MSYDGSLKFDTAINESGFNTGIKNLGSIAKSGLSVLGGAIAGVTAAMGAGVSAAVNVGMSFESQMSKVQAISGATGSELEALTEKAKEMGATTKFSATESGQAFEYMAMAGWKTEDMLGGIEGIMNLAAASGEDLAATSDIVTDALTAFGLSASDSGHFADILAAASSNANTNVGLMGETFKYVAPVAGALGFSAEDTATAIGLMANAGIKGSQAGTALRSIMSRLVKPTDDVAIAMSELGLSILNSDGSMKSLNEITGDLRSRFAGLSEAEKASMAATLGGQEAMSGLLAIVNVSEEDFNKLQSAIYGATDELTGYSAAAEMAETMQNNLAGQLTSLRSAAEGLGIELYESVKQPLTDIAKTGVEAVRELTTAFQEGGTEGLIEAGGKLIADLLTGIAGALPDVITTAVQVITSIIDSLTANTPQMLSAGIQILQALFDGMIQILPAVGEFVLSLMTELYAQITAHGPELLQKGYELLSNLVDGFVQAIPEMLPKVLDFIQGIGEKLAEAAPVLIEKGFELLSKLVEGIVTAIPILIARVPEIITTFANIINDNFPTILAKGVELLGQLAMGLIQAIPDLIAHIPEIIEAIVSVFTAYNWLALGKNIIQFLGNGIKSMASAAATAAKNVQTGIINAIKNLPNTLSNLGKNAISGLGKAISSGIKTVVGYAKDVVSGIKNAFTSLNWGSIGSNIIKGIANGIVGAIGGLISAAVSASKSALNAVLHFFGINSPSRVFRDMVGKNMALGMGIGFEKNVPTDEMEASLRNSVERMQHTAKKITSAPLNTTRQIISRSNDPKTGPSPEYPEFDYERMGKETAKAMEGMGVYLDKKPAGRILAPVINDELGRIDRRKT
nr:phage tail tape measure protein [uncultured Schaedlerella sp.]